MILPSLLGLGFACLSVGVVVVMYLDGLFARETLGKSIMFCLFLAGVNIGNVTLLLHLLFPTR